MLCLLHWFSFVTEKFSKAVLNESLLESLSSLLERVFQIVTFLSECTQHGAYDPTENTPDLLVHICNEQQLPK